MNNANILVKDEEIDRYQESLQAYLGQQMDADRFTATRLQQGIYGQRQEGVNMVRCKIPGGNLTPEQLIAIADVLEQYVQHDVVHISTRQNFQIHYVPLGDTPAVIRRLGKAGLTTREACGNTVRNITAGPLTGLCAHEYVDITTHLDAAVVYFLRHPLTQHLPRKFKISFSGCECDPAQGMLHDLGVVAAKRGGRFGFRIVAGGGLGHKPHEAITVEEFIEEKDLLPCMEAIISLHHRYSDRKKRAKARIKFLVDRFGPEGFIEKYQEEYARTKAAFVDNPYPQGEWADTEGATGEACSAGAPRQVIAQKQPGLYVFPIGIHIGDINAAQLRGIAKLMEEEGLAQLRTTQDQNLILINVPEARIKTIRERLAALDLREPQTGEDVVACPGTSTCRLGITSSKILGAKFHGAMESLRVRVSGCHNGCAQPEMGDIGVYGEGKRLHGKLIPHYQTYFGGDGRTGGGLAFKGPSIPAARIEQAVHRVRETYNEDHERAESFFQWTRRHGKEYFTELLADLTIITADDIPLVLHDHGDNQAFKVLQLGGGECAGAAQELVSANFSEAAYERNTRNAFASHSKFKEAFECAEAILRLVALSLAFVSGQNKTDDVLEIARLLQEAQPEHAHLGKKLAELSQRLSELKTQFDAPAFASLMKELDDWTTQAAQACQTLDGQLDLSLSIPVQTTSVAMPAAAPVDLSTYGCPVHYMKARLELGKISVGDAIEFILESGESTEQVSASLRKDGHSILSVENGGGTTRVRVRKAEAAIEQNTA